jgi:arylsulfatase A-like enzyme
VVGEMKTQEMYDNSLIVFSADNGGPIYKGGSAAANNW